MAAKCWWLWPCAVFVMYPLWLPGQPVLRVVRSAESGAPLLRNGHFEQNDGGKLTRWNSDPNGYHLAAGAGRDHSHALLCENSAESQFSGASQTLRLDRTNVAPLVLRGWSKAENISGSPDNDYSLYVDIVYTDGTPLWGQTARFHTGTHDWQQSETIILPEKPIKTLTLHCLLRKHTGRAWFDDVTLEEVNERQGAFLFQGAPVSVAPVSAATKGPSVYLRTRDGLQLSLVDNAVAQVNVGGRNVRSRAPSGFLVRDVAADSDFYPFHSGRCPELGLSLRADWKAEPDHLAVEGRVTDLTGKDRAVTLVFALPVDAEGWEWGQDIRRSRPVAGPGDFANLVTIGCGATRTTSLYPLATVFNSHTGLALALDLGQPAQFRVGYHAGLKQLYIAYDFGLAPEPKQFPRSADFRFVVYTCDPRWGFRAAFQKFTEIFPEYFRVRSPDQGIWMPFTDISKVERWADFGFKYHEGNNNVPWDDGHGVLSFRYTEPMTWWMPIEKGAPRTISEAVEVRRAMTGSPDRHQRDMARLAGTAAMWDETGQPELQFQDTPWCDGAVWSLNPNPRLPVSAFEAGTNAGVENRFNAATVYWNADIKQRLYGPAAKGVQDGEYLDSIEGYVTADLNYRREHFRYTTVPLCFDAETHAPALYKGLAVFEFTKWLSTDVHALGKLMFANGVPYRFAWLCPWLDVLGTETDWLQGGKYEPVPDSRMSFWRTMAGRKPYLLLMNTDYNAFTPELVERYFQRSLFYGMFPSMFSHNAADNPYWQNPKWYNRDRPWFKKCLPIIKQVAEAGWQPVTGARCDNPRIWVERFGPNAKSAVYLTLFNDSDQVQRGLLSADPQLLPLDPAAGDTELLSETEIKRAGKGWEIELGPQQARVIRLAPAQPR